MTNKTITIAAVMPETIAYQLAQFIKRSAFDTFYEYTDAHLPHEERKAQAYQMIAGIEAVQDGLANAGIAPR